MGTAGREYDVGFWQKVSLMRAAFRNGGQLGSATSFLEQLTLLDAILSIPKNLEGAVAEFGCFKGMSTASLSLACRAAGRRLVVFDSYEGLPEPLEQVTGIATSQPVPYFKGQLKGMLEEVKQNVSSFGEIGVCEFVKGYFEDSLPGRDSAEKYCLIFEDADLPSSVRTVIRHAWPRLQNGCFFFTHEARDLEVMKIFFDDSFWKETVDSNAPGIVGSGLGLTLSPVGSGLGYVRKTTSAEQP